MKVFRISSDRSSTPLAEVRTDGTRLEFIVDNTNGSLPKSTGGLYDRLVQLVNSSSHLTMTQPTEATAHLLRYVLTNGDVAEITNDGKTAVLNGRLLQPEEKNALFQAIKTGQVGIARKADLSAPHPVLPALQSFAKPAQPTHDKITAQAIGKLQQKQQDKQRSSTVDYDHSIEDSDYRGMENPEWAKQFMYQLKYGASRGRRK